MNTILKVAIKPYTNKELAQMFNMSTRTFNRNIKAIRGQLGKRMGHFWSIPQIEIILEHMGSPYETIEIERPDIRKIKPLQIKFHPQEIQDVKKAS
jgi:uncharacterized Fe-S cluster-containing radical SAM superfamily protein